MLYSPVHIPISLRVFNNINGIAINTIATARWKKCNALTSSVIRLDKIKKTAETRHPTIFFHMKFNNKIKTTIANAKWIHEKVLIILPPLQTAISKPILTGWKPIQNVAFFLKAKPLAPNTPNITPAAAAI